MNESFYEESVSTENNRKRKLLKTQFKVFFIVFLVVAVVCYIIAASQNSAMSGEKNKEAMGFFIFYLVVAIMSTLMSVLFLILSMRMIFSYDYTYVSGSLSIAKIINNARRKKIADIDCRKILSIGRVGSDSFYTQQESAGISQTVKCYADKNNDENHIYLLVNSNAGKTMYLLECSDSLVSCILNFTGNSVLAKDFE